MTEAIGGPLQRYPSTNSKLYPLFKIAKGLLENPDFMPEGGPLGIYCTHPYYHTRKLTQTLMPFSLRGIDAITFSVFRALGLKVLVAPVLGDEAWDEWEQAREEKWMQKIYGDEPMAEGVVVEEEEEDAGDKTRVGKSWHKMRMVSGEGGIGLRVGEDPTPFTNYHYPLHVLPSVTWLNESTENWEIAMVNLKKHLRLHPWPIRNRNRNRNGSHVAILTRRHIHRDPSD
ncbi:hypothetical protein LSUB1_G002009 [Lachnellula subtilissima]|uniref:Uncharacterized protein n=1 Tax=Lachnellula subtilissima TaxID=602034 RepID=A0A8H8RQM9_9HELO|nr:hypothetical protein LSUB1_G002009 [Lachnellula subtilissima]